MLNRAAEKPVRRRLPGVDVRVGSVKQARSEAGLSLAELAGGRVTRAAIHLVETGRSRPSMPVLEMIAERTGKPVAWFLDAAGRSQTRNLEREARIGELEAISESQDYPAALELATGLLADIHGEEEEARVRHFLGRALVRLHRADEAIVPLRRALGLFEALTDELMVVETMDWLAGALFELEDPTALGLEEEALRRCRRLDPVPAGTEIRILTNLASVHAARREWSKAAKLYEAVLERGRDVQDMRRLARVYLGLGMSYRQLGDLNRAVTFTQRAVAFEALQHDRTSLCRAEVQLGRLLLTHGDVNTAEKHLHRALTSARELGLEYDRRQVELAIADLHLLRGELDPATRIALDVLEDARRDRRPQTEAEAHSVLGRAQALAGDARGADQHFQAALGLLEIAGLVDQRVDTLHAYARVLKERGDMAAAYQQLETAMELTRPGLAGAAPQSGRGASELA